MRYLAVQLLNVKLWPNNLYDRFKYPLSVIDQLLADAGSDSQITSDSAKMHLMYDIICKLEKSLKVKAFNQLLPNGVYVLTIVTFQYKINRKIFQG